MEITGLKCSGCGSSDVEFVPESKKIICHQCGKEEYYSRATLNKNGKVIMAKDNAIKFFLESNLESSKYYALEVLNIFDDNIPARYIVSYFEEVKNGRINSIKDFFDYIKEKDIALEYDEVRDLQKLIIASLRILCDYEMDIIEIFVKNMQSDKDRKELSEFIDKICPYFIKSRVSIDFFKDRGFEYYLELVQNLDIPKTCYSLIKSIDENPNSPYMDNSFFLASKTKYFYDNFVIKVGRIVEVMKGSEYKAKLKMAYTQVLSKYKENAGY